MIPEFITIEDKLLNRLRAVRRGWFRHLVLQCLVGFGVSSALVLGFQWLSGEQLDAWQLNWPLLLWGIVFLVLIIKAKPTLGHCAAVFDQVNDNNSQVQTAYELALGNPDSEFALWAIRVGVSSITEERSRKVRLHVGLLPCLEIQFLVVMLSLLGTGASEAVLSPLRRVVSGVSTVSAPVTRPVPSEIGGASLGRLSEGRGGVGGAEGLEGRVAAGGLGWGTDALSGAGIGTARENGHVPEGEGRESGHGEQAQAQRSSFALSGERSSDVGNNYGSEAFELSPQDMGVSSEDMAMAEDEARKEGQDRSQAGVGNRPLSLDLHDASLPAGRDVASEGGEDDGEEPTESPRGDAQGEKSGREIASMLPVMPLADAISGMLGMGEEVRQQTRSGTSNREEFPAVRMMATGVQEPALPSRQHPRRFRRYMNMRNSHD